ncbi:MAG: hypothetical protein Kapaf2KO_23250 [Candidatus Kapaibacteriales bacterium]
MNDIARECGVYKGSIYHFFKSKNDLFEEVFNYYMDFLNNEIFTVAYKKSKDEVVKINTFFTVYLDKVFHPNRLPFYIEVISESRLNPDYIRNANSVSTKMVSSIAVLISKKPDSQEALESAKTIFKAILGAHYTSVAGISTGTMDDVRQLALFLRKSKLQ